MWRVAGRMAGVFASWGVILGLAISGGVPPHPAEVFSVCGAGLSLILWGFSVNRLERRIEVITTDEPTAAANKRASL